jgi:hypothetical protein
MARLNKPEVKTPDLNTRYVTLIGDILPDQTWDIPAELRIDETSPKTDTGIVQIQIDGEDLNLSRSGLNLTIDEKLIGKIVDTLSELGYTNDFQILQTGENDGTAPEHYSKSDYQILQAKIVPSAYLTKFNAPLTKRYPAVL